MNALPRFLALDTSTDEMSVALGLLDQPLLERAEPGGAKASAHVLPMVAQVLAQQGWALTELSALVFGQGPGAFTGLRTACAVVQGLAYGAGVPVVPVSTLLACAEAARVLRPVPEADWRVCAMLDARMNEVYVASYAYSATQGWQVLSEPALCAPQALTLSQGETTLVGNAWAVYADAWPAALHAVERMDSRPGAAACLRLGQRAWAQGLALPAHAAQPVYVRNKVAQTTAEREALARASQAADA